MPDDEEDKDRPAPRSSPAATFSSRLASRTKLGSLRLAVAAFCLVVLIGVAGYMILGQMSLGEALYTTIAIISTVGVDVQLTGRTRVFTAILIVLGVGAMFYALSTVFEFIVEGHFQLALGRRLMDKRIAGLKDHYIICGFGRVGEQIALEFTAAHKPFVVIDHNPDAISRCHAHNYPYVEGNAHDDNVLNVAGIMRARGLMASMDTDADNIYVTLSARSLNAKLFIVARANRDDTEPKLRRAGADRVLSPYHIGGHRMASLALQPGVVEFLDTAMLSSNLDLGMEEVEVTARFPLAGLSLAQARANVEFPALVLAIKKRGDLISNPKSNATIQPGDRVILLGDPRDLQAIVEAAGR